MIDQVHFAAIKARLTDVPGIEGLSVSNVGGRLEFGMAGKIAATAENAPDADIESAIRIIFGGKTVTDTTTTTTAVPAAPSPIAAQPAAAAPIPSNITGATHATMSIADIVKDAKKSVEDAHQNVIAGATRIKASAARLSGIGDSLNSEADALDSMAGQYTNS